MPQVVPPAFTPQQLQALTNAIAQGITRVEYPGHATVNYASIEDMLKLRDRMVKEMNSVGDNVRPPVARPSVFVRG